MEGDRSTRALTSWPCLPAVVAGQLQSSAAQFSAKAAPNSEPITHNMSMLTSPSLFLATSHFFTASTSLTIFLASMGPKLFASSYLTVE